MKIEGKTLDEQTDYLSPVTYVPNHADGNADHPDCEQGVIIGLAGNIVRVLYCKARTVQRTNPDDLVWG